MVEGLVFCRTWGLPMAHCGAGPGVPQGDPALGALGLAHEGSDEPHHLTPVHPQTLVPQVGTR